MVVIDVHKLMGIPKRVSIIGAGVAGYVTAIRAAQLGFQVFLFEKQKHLGGTCLNVGCIPSKALLESSEHYEMAKKTFIDHGITMKGIGLDLVTTMNRKQEVVRRLTDGVKHLVEKNKITLRTGTAELFTEEVVRHSSESSFGDCRSDYIVIATGSVPIELPFMPFDGKRIITSTEALSLNNVPKHLIVVGGGAIGLELGSVWKRFGAEVTIIEAMPRPVPTADKTISTRMMRFLKAQGIKFMVNSRVTAAKIEEEQVFLTVEGKKGKETTICGDKVLVAVGRRPFTDGLKLSERGVELDSSGFIKVDKTTYETSTPGIYAIGDVIGGPMLAHKAEEEAIALAEGLEGDQKQVDYDLIPSVVYTSPELAMVGLTEEEAKKQKIAIRIGRVLFSANGRAVSMGTTDGMVKIVADKKNDRILGVHILGPQASELIGEVVVAMKCKMTVRELAHTVHAHPTLSEVIKEAALSVHKESINT